MTDSENGDEEFDPMEKLKSTQNKERKDLQAKITALKHSIQKSDKKKKKEIAQQIENLEKELSERHKEELQKLTNSIGKIAINGNEENSAEEMKQSQIEESIENLVDKGKMPSLKFKEIQLTKAQKKKEEKRKKHALARAAAEAEDEKNAESSQGTKERKALQRLLAEQGLQIHEIQPDGDCLFSALAHQCAQWQLGNYSMTKLRRMAADHIKHRKEEFLPFIVDPDGHPLEEGEFMDYCDKIAKMCSDGGNWGGEPELRAISNLLGHRIEVLRSNGQKSVFGEHFEANDPLLITYHSHAFSLGEHYNSTEPMQMLKEEDEF